MATTEQRRATAERIRGAEAAAEEVRRSLAERGITLPSLRIDLLSCVGDTGHALVDLGRCHPATARLLAAALRGDAR